MNIFITGATGYIGFEVAKTLRNAGHVVWGLTRSEEKKTRLLREEIKPVIGDMQNPDSYREIADNCSVLIHAAIDYENDTKELDLKTVDQLLVSGKTGEQPKIVIYTSGCWILGNTEGKAVTETTPINPLPSVAYRKEAERKITETDWIRGIVIRPGCVYGHQAGLTSLWFSEAHNKKTLHPIGDRNTHWTMVHVEDLARAYQKAVESHLAGEIFNISDHSRPTIGQMADAIASVTGTKEVDFRPVKEARSDFGSMADSLALDQIVDPGKAERLLNWHPNHHGFIHNVALYYESWKAWQ